MIGSRWQPRRLLLITLVAWLLLASAATAVGPQQLGATLDGEASTVHFRVYSRHATRVELWAFDAPFGSAPTASGTAAATPTGGWRIKIISNTQDPKSICQSRLMSSTRARSLCSLKSESLDGCCDM